MRTFIGAVSFMLAVSPWILPSIAAAARLTHDELGQNRSGDDGNARAAGETRHQPASHGCIAARPAGERRPQ